MFIVKTASPTADKIKTFKEFFIPGWNYSDLSKTLCR
jgi:hypothetical protein